MAIKMTHTARAELTDVVRKRYRAAAGADKSKILDEFIAVTGYHHKSAIRALNSEPTSKKRQTRARPPSTTRRFRLRSSFSGRHPTGYAGSG